MFKFSKDRPTRGYSPEGVGTDLSIFFKPSNTRRIGKEIPLKCPKNIKGVPPAYRDIFDRTRHYISGYDNM